MKKITVVKTTGETELFDKRKIIRTCIRSGIPENEANRISEVVEREAFNGISTRQVLRITLNLIKKYDKYSAKRYDLKGSLFRLGPSGFPFEIFVSRLLTEYGWKTKTHQILSGKCVFHEIDVIAEKSGRYPIECKYHNAPGIYTGIKDALYVYARFLDLEKHKFSQPWLTTNTLFSRDALKYSKCMNFRLLSWSYPKDEGLSSLLEKKRLYPITILSSLNKKQIISLVNKNILFCKDVLNSKYFVKKTLRIPEQKIKLISTEAEKIIGD